MGNDIGKPSCPLGLAAMAATTTNIETAEATILFNKCVKLGNATGNPDQFTRPDLETALKEKGLEAFQPSDCELLDKLFTMFDNSGDGNVVTKEYFVALATLTSGV